MVTGDNQLGTPFQAAFHLPSEMCVSSAEFLVSVIVPTKNSARTLGACLLSIRAQAYPHIELIVVDNHSTDETLVIAHELAHQVATRGPERGAQKNHGARLAKGEYVLFIDSDMVLPPGIVTSCVKRAAPNHIISIPEESFGEGFWAQAKVLERRCYVGNEVVEAARFFHRKQFFALGGFDEDLVASGDDLDLSQRARRAGYQLVRIPDLIYHDEGSPSPAQTLRKWRYYGRDMAKYWRKNPKEARAQYNPLRRGWLQNWQMLVRAPHLTVGFLILKACQLAGVLLGVLDSYRESRQSEFANSHR